MLRKAYDFCLLISILILFMALVSGCAKPPTKEMEQAEKTMAEAKEKEVDLYVGDVFSKAEASFKNAKDLVGAKKYKEAKAALEDVTKAIKEAIPLVEQNKTKLKAEVEQLIQDLAQEITEMKPALAKAIKQMKAEEQKEAQGMLGKWELEMVNIKEMLQGQKIKQAYDGIKPIKEQILAQKEKMKASPEAKPAKK